MKNLRCFVGLALVLLSNSVCLAVAQRLSFLDRLFARRDEIPGHPHSTNRIATELHLKDIATTVHNEVDHAPIELFGEARDFVDGDMSNGSHPRILFSRAEWETLVETYARDINMAGSWSKAFIAYTMDKGPLNQRLTRLANLDTSAYTGEVGMDKEELLKLASETLLMDEYSMGGMFLSSLHAYVNEKIEIEGGTGYLEENQRFDRAINMIVNYAKILLSHYSVYACETCEYKYGIKYTDLWNPIRGWTINNDWITAGIGMALSYDVLHERMDDEQRKFVRSAIGIMVKGRQHWGITDFSNRYSPNAIMHPHRIFSNWATYHAHLYLTNLAIEGETEFDNMTTKVGVGFNHDINDKSIALFDAFMKHSIYPEGSSFEDGYMYNLAFREGSLAFLALAKRGYNHIDTPRFRNFIYNAAQMHEPFQCGHFVGHSSGGGELYPAFYALFRYSYPNSSLTNMMWAQRMGLEFKSRESCRIWWHQTALQLSILGASHSIDYDNPDGLPVDHKRLFVKSIYHPRRGIVVARTDHSTESLYYHFDARPDAIFLGHDNADRGVVTMSALGRTWLDDFDWKGFPNSQDHSIMHIDGQAQALKAPSVRMLKVGDDGDVVLAAADLTYAYNVQWARAWSSEWQPFHWEYIFVDGKKHLRQVVYEDRESGSPLDFGWPKGDDTSDIGITSSTKMWGEDNLGFAGNYIWKRKYRTVDVKHAVRSTALVRSKNPEESYLVVADNYAMTGTAKHSFEQYFIFAPGVSVAPTSQCDAPPCTCATKPCVVYLTGDMPDNSTRTLELHVSTVGSDVSYNYTDMIVHRTVRKDEYNNTVVKEKRGMRLVVTSAGMNAEKFCSVLYPHRGDKVDNLKLMRFADTCFVTVGADTKTFQFNATDQTLERSGSEFGSIAAQEFVYPSPPPTPSASATPSTTPAEASPTATAMPTISVTSSASTTAHYEASASASPVDDYWEHDSLFPMDPLPLPESETFDIKKNEINTRYGNFFSHRAVHKDNEGQVVFDVLAFEDAAMVIDTCFETTNVATSIEVWDCGPFGEDGEVAYNNYYGRENCHQVQNMHEHEECGGKKKGVFIFKPQNAVFEEGEFGMYFVVVTVDKVREDSQFSIAYHLADEDADVITRHEFVDEQLGELGE